MSDIRYLTEEEAQKVLCPAREKDNGLQKAMDDLRYVSTSGKSYAPDDATKHFTCRGQFCMFWRWQIQIEALGQSETPGGKGYCSLYGVENPKVPV